jgi:hypothetical protein
VRARLAARELIDVDLHMHTTIPTTARRRSTCCLATRARRGPRRDRGDDHNEVSGALDARAKAAEYGVKVIVAEEVKTASQGEVIGLFIEEKIARGMSLEETIAEISARAGSCTCPHPFDRMHSVPDYEHLLAVVEDVDAIEVFNPRIAIPAYNERRCASPPSTGSWPAPARTRTSPRAWARCACGCPTSTGRRVPRGAARREIRTEAVEPALRAGAQVPRDEGHPARGAQGAPRAAGRRATARADAGRGTASRRRIPRGRCPRPTTRSARSTSSARSGAQPAHPRPQDCPTARADRSCRCSARATRRPTSSSCKFAPTVSEIEEGVRSTAGPGPALMKSLQRPGHRPARGLRHAVRQVPRRGHRAGRP